MTLPSALRATLRVFPWYSDIPTMMPPEELAFLYHLARRRWDGDTDILEIGPWLGASTYAIAKGALGVRRTPHARLKAVDTFTWRPFMEDLVSLGLRPGESFQSLVEDNLKGVRDPRSTPDFVQLMQRSLTDDRSADLRHDEPMRSEEPTVPTLTVADIPRPCGLVVVDGAKSWAAMLHLLRILGQVGIPGTTVVVWQDYRDWGSYWVHMALEAVGPAFRRMHAPPWAPVVMVLTQRPRTDELPAVIDEVPRKVADSWLSAAAQSGDLQLRLAVELGRSLYEATFGDESRIAERYRTAAARWPDSLPNATLRSYADWASNWVNLDELQPPRYESRLRRLTWLVRATRGWSVGAQ